jgi:beta-lactamase superfamily II metal-dependent hydrolase
MAQLEINFVNIGQGDCTLVKCPDGTTIMIDCGTHQAASDDTFIKRKENKDKWKAELGRLSRLSAKQKKETIDYEKRYNAAVKFARSWEKSYNEIKSTNNLNTNTLVQQSILDFLPLAEDGVTKKKKIDFLILTHHDEDHYNKVVEFTGLVSFGTVYYSGPIGRYRMLRENYASPTNVDRYISITVNGIAEDDQSKIETHPGASVVISDEPHTVYHKDEVEITILASNVHNHPLDQAVKDAADRHFRFDAVDINSRSIVTMLRYIGDKILIMGDATTATEDFLIHNYDDDTLKADTLRIGHHGSDSSSKLEFIQKVRPAMCLISCGKYNTHGHPRRIITDRVIQYYKNPGVEVEEHDLNAYSNATKYETTRIKEPLWTTWSLDPTLTPYDGT